MKSRSSRYRRIAALIRLRKMMFSWIFSRRRSIKRYFRRSSSDVGSSSATGKGSGWALLSTVRADTSTSIEPDARRGLTVSGERRTTAPRMAITDSACRWEACRNSSSCSGCITNWQIPVWSRRSMKIRPPWSLIRWTQPARLTSSCLSSSPREPQ